MWLSASSLRAFRSRENPLESSGAGAARRVHQAVGGFELIDVSFQDVIGGRQYDIRSKTTGKSERTLYAGISFWPA